MKFPGAGLALAAPPASAVALTTTVKSSIGHCERFPSRLRHDATVSDRVADGLTISSRRATIEGFLTAEEREREREEHAIALNGVASELENSEGSRNSYVVVGCEGKYHVDGRARVCVRAHTIPHAYAHTRAPELHVRHRTSARPLVV